MARVGQENPKLTRAPFEGAEDLAGRWGDVDFLALPHRDTDRYIAGFANSDRCVEAALRLRFQVFNVELEEGLSDSLNTGLDRDEYDAQMTHLVLLDKESEDVVGTYRIQAARDASRGRGLYSAQEYELAPLQGYLESSVELGRACLAVEHRNFRAMIAMWLGIGGFMNVYGLRYLFGCCSLTTQDPDDGWRALKTLREADCLHPDLLLKAMPGYSCGSRDRALDPELGAGYKLPKLFRTYLKLGSKVISEPAIDRAFGTVDFLVLLDGKEVALSRLDVLR